MGYGSLSVPIQFTSGWQKIPDRNKKVFKLGFVLLFSTMITVPIALFIFYLAEYTIPLDIIVSLVVGIEMGATLLIAIGISGYSVLFYRNGHPIVAAISLIVYIVLFGSLYWISLRLLSLTLAPLLIGFVCSLILMGILQLYAKV